MAAVHKTALYDASVQHEANLATKRILSEYADAVEAEDLMQEIAEAAEKKLATGEGPEDRCAFGCVGRADSLKSQAWGLRSRSCGWMTTDRCAEFGCWRLSWAGPAPSSRTKTLGNVYVLCQGGRAGCG